MNTETIQLIEQLSAKLGTTSEYLWSVLIRQAHVSAIITFIAIAIILAIGLVFYRLIWSKFGDDEYDDEFSGAAMITTFILWVIALIISVCFVGNAITGLINPEYWALKQILDALSQ